MADTQTFNPPVLQVSSDGNTWNTSLQVESGKETVVYFKITTHENTNMRIVLPIYNKNDSSSISSAVALLTADQEYKLDLKPDENKGVTLKNSNDLLGAYDLRITEPGITETVLLLTFTPQLVDNATPKAECKILYRIGRMPWKNDAPSVNVIITKNTAPPYVLKFTTDRSVLVDGESTELIWEVNNADTVIIKVGINPEKSYDPKGTLPLTNLTDDTVVALTPYQDDGKAFPTQFINIKIITKSDIYSKSSLFNEGTSQNQSYGSLLNLFTVDPTDKLYALVLNNSQDNVWMWESFDGLMWKKTNAYSKVPAFVSAGNSTNVPLEFAGNPSVVYNNKVYLIGGSRFDPKIQSDKVYYYDFLEQDKGWQQSADAPFAERMGHACVVYNNEIWVLGGFNGMETFDDAWAFNALDETWRQLRFDESFGSVCMHSALVFNDQLCVYGGFSDVPGFPDRSIYDSLYFDKEANAWKAFEWNQDLQQILYSACSAASCKGSKFLFYAYCDNKWSHMAQRILQDSDLEDQITAGGWLISDNYYSIQTVTFKEVVWLCSVIQDQGVSSNDLRYFAYCPGNTHADGRSLFNEENVGLQHRFTGLT